MIKSTFLVLMGLTLPIAGCATGARVASSSGGGDGGDGDSGGAGPGAGGAGGANCVPEVCDGIDNNCDGVVDEGCDCTAGETEACYSGPDGTMGVGLCKPGTRVCDPATHKYGPCLGEVLPAAAEACDGKDEDCNGMVDDGLPDITCGVGACAATAPACVGGQPGTCVPGQPKQEICDGIDNDCDQFTDESFPESGMACDTGIPGICAAGTSQCNGGALSCVQNMMSKAETCDGLDNDCDGVVDNNIPGTGGACSTGAPGVCSEGTISCQGGSIDCYSTVPASPEVCDGLDNNCDGFTDENNPEGGMACDTGQLGACGQGTRNCVGGTLVCQPNAQALPESCDGVDNNCDGQIDEGSPGAGMPCSCGGTSVCMSGQLFCQGCTKEVDCNNGLDDDGDAAIDCADTQCALGCNANVGPCAAGQRLLVLSSTDIPKSIPDGGSTFSTITFTEAATVKRVALQFNVTHSWDADLDISLKSPSNTSIDVTSDNGGGGLNYTNTIFNDACGTPVTSGASPFSGCYSPEQPLSTFVDQPLKGVWTLNLVDDSLFDTGSLSSWSLAICVQ